MILGKVGASFSVKGVPCVCVTAHFSADITATSSEVLIGGNERGQSPGRLSFSACELEFCDALTIGFHCDHTHNLFFQLFFALP